MNWYKKTFLKLSSDFDFSEEYYNAVHNVLTEFISNPKGKQPWAVVPAARLKKIWEDFSRYGIVRDEAGLEEIIRQIIRNVFRIQVNTELCGHESVDPKELYEQEGIKFTKRIDELFGDYVLHNGQWRISDYALKPLFEDIEKLQNTSDPKEKLLIVDHMLNIVHQRGDLAASFVEGGRSTLNSLNESVEEKEKIDNIKNKEVPPTIALNSSEWYKKAQKINGDQFCRGYCAEFALALHRITGWQVVAFNELEYDDNEEEEYGIPCHYALRSPSGKYADARGLRTEKEIANNLMASDATPLQKYNVENLTENDLLASSEIIDEMVNEAEKFISKNRKLWGAK